MRSPKTPNLNDDIIFRVPQALRKLCNITNLAQLRAGKSSVLLQTCPVKSNVKIKRQFKRLEEINDKAL